MKITKNDKGIYQVHHQGVGGKRLVTSLKTSNQDQAKAIVKQSNLQELELAAKAGNLTSQVLGRILAGRKITTAQAFQQWAEWAQSVSNSVNTTQNYLSMVAIWIESEQLENLAPSLLAEKHIDAWINSQAREVKRGTRNVELAAIRHFFRFLSIRGLIIGDPSRGVCVKRSLLTHAQMEPREKAVFTDAEIRLLLNETDPRKIEKIIKRLELDIAEAKKDVEKSVYSSERTAAIQKLNTLKRDHDKAVADVPWMLFWHCATAIGRWTGLRLGDIANLQWDCFAIPSKMKVWTGKSGASVLLPVNEPAALANAIALLPYSDQTYCFPEQREIIRDFKRRAMLSVQFSRLCVGLGITGKSFHCLRHTYATEARRLGKEMGHIAEDLGHRFTETTKRYVH